MVIDHRSESSIIRIKSDPKDQTNLIRLAVIGCLLPRASARFLDLLNQLAAPC